MAEISQLRHELASSRRMKSLGLLLDGIAHDFNNLLMVIGSYASLVHEEVSMAEASDSATRWRPVRSDLEQIQDANERAKMLIKHMLAFARRESAPAQDVNLGQVASDASLLLGELLGEQIPVTIQPARDAWPVRANIDEHERHLALGELIEQGFFEAEGHDGNAFDLALQHAPDAVRHPLGVVVGGADENFVAVLDGDVFKALNELGKEGVGDFGNQQTKELAAA